MSRPLLFRLLAVLLGLGLLAVVEGVLWLVPSPSEDPYVDLASFTLFSRVEEKGREWVKITHPYAYPERATRFEATKPSETQRVFVLGASAAAGWPHPPDETFGTYLEASLEAAGGPALEVINASAHGFPSYRVRKIFEEILHFQPDAIILYCGNNEFLESRDYRSETLSGLSRLLGHSQIVRRSRRLLPNSDRLDGDELNELAASMWAKVQRQAALLRSDPEQFTMVRRHYAQSVGFMVEEAERQDIPLLLLTVPSNLRDWLPVVSSEVPEESRPSWQAAFDAGRAALLHSNAELAVQELSLATELAPERAESWFWLGRAVETNGDPAAALRAYRQAKDHDLNPFRAISAFNQALRELASTHNATLIDLEAAFDNQAVGAAPGFDLFLDYVHPTVAGNRLIARAIGPPLAEQLDRPTPQDEKLPTTDYREEEDFTLQMKKLGMALINHQYIPAIATAHQIQALVSSPPRLAPTPVPGEVPEVVSETLRVLVPYVRSEQRQRLGSASATEQFDDAETLRREFYERWFQYGTF